MIVVELKQQLKNVSYVQSKNRFKSSTQKSNISNVSNLKRNLAPPNRASVFKTRYP